MPSKKRAPRRGPAGAMVLAAVLAGAGSSAAANRATVSPVAACAGAEPVVTEPPPDGIASVASYAIYSGRDRVGGLDSVRRSLDEGRRLEISYRARIDIDGLLFGYSLDSRESICIVDGRMEAYAAEVEEDGEKSAVQAVRSGPERLSVSGSGSRARDTFEETLAGEGYATLFETAADAVVEERSAAVSRVVLDLDDLEIKEIRYRYAGEAEVVAGDTTFTAHVVTFEGAANKGTQWLIADRGGFFPVLERGEDEDGEYSVELLTLERPGIEGRR